MEAISLGYKRLGYTQENFFLEIFAGATDLEQLGFELPHSRVSSKHAVPIRRTALSRRT